MAALDKASVPAGSRSVGDRQIVLIGLVPVVLLAVVSLWYPESPDQSLFATTAQQLREGSVYFRDVWDLKQPGIYWLYVLGDLVVPGGLGTRLIECVLAVAAAALVSWFVSGWGLRRSVRLAAPTVVLGPYLAYAGLSGMGEIEGLMNPLLIAAVVCCWPRPVGRAEAEAEAGADAEAAGRVGPRTSSMWFLAGLVVGAVCLLKTLYVPVPLVVLAGAALVTIRAHRRVTLQRVGIAVLGALLPVLVACAYLAAQGVLGVALRTTFVIPLAAASQSGLHDGLLELPRALKNMFAVVGPLAVAGLLTARRRGRLPLAATLTVSATVAFALALPQLWTAYRWLMLSAPVGLVAISGLDEVLAWLQRLRPRQLRRGLRVVAALAVAGLSTLLLRPTFAAVRPAQDWGLDPTSRIVRAQTADPLTHSLAVSALARAEVPAGSRVYVLGDTRISTLLDARSGAAVVGLTMQSMPDEVWAELSRELEATRPPAIYVGERQAVALRDPRGQRIRDLLDDRYETFATSADGTWYRTDDPGDPAGAGYRSPGG